ncbi:MAG TPA: hypothetical protein VMR95_01825 [Candidatus Binatia bacterium]|nr:hypothetical protein [Candidatus Binatia bacterium]
MDNPKAQIVDRVKQANNVLVTVSANPSVDQLAAAIGLTLLLNKLGKHATAVFSGAVPSTIEFLEPEKTLEKNTDSLRDFIIALDKSKADKLRYKVEENVVKIFITPYRTSISEKDLDFSQGDFNVDIVMALGVKAPAELDQAITAHGRILHDATVVSINNAPGGDLGSIHWQDPAASSLSEMTVVLGNDLDKNLLDGQIATALLTGIVAETDRFSNHKTTPTTMSISSELMSAGANQQLVATKLQPPPPVPKVEDKPKPQAPPQVTTPLPPAQPPQPPAEPPKPDDGMIEIDHEKADKTEEAAKEPDLSQIHVDDQGNLHTLDKRPPLKPLADQPDAAPPGGGLSDNTRFVTNPPSLGGTLTANSRPQDLEPTTDALSLPPVDTPFLSHNSDDGLKGSVPEAPVVTEPPTVPQPTKDNETLSELEKEIGSPHALASSAEPSQSSSAGIDAARGAVETAITQDPGASTTPFTPTNSLSALPVFDSPDPEDQPAGTPNSFNSPSDALGLNSIAQPPTDQFPGESLNMPLPSAGFSSNLTPPTQPSSGGPDPMAPPPVPPPMLPFSPPPSA